MKQNSGLYNYNGIADELLAQKAKEGSSEAIEELIVRYTPLVSYLARPYKQSGMELDDLQQEGLIGLFKAIRMFNPQYDNSFKTFANKCITNKIISAVSSFLRGKNLPMKNYLSLSDLDGLNNIIQKDVCDPQEIFIQNENISARKKQITSLLSEYEQAALRLYLSGYSYADMAKELNSSIKSVDNSLQRIKRKLRSVEN